MKRKIAISLLIVISILLMVSCKENITNRETSARNYGEKNTNKVCYIYDSQKPVLMSPDLDHVKKIMIKHNTEMDIIDLNKQHYGLKLKTADLERYNGLIICLNYDYDVEQLLIQLYDSRINIIQFGGEYYPNDISVSVDFSNVGYQVGKKTGEFFSQRNLTNPRLGFFSIENEWKKFEKGFIEGLSEIVPDAQIVSRKIASPDKKTAILSGEKDLSSLNAVAIFFWDEGFKDILYDNEVMKIRIGEKRMDEESNDLLFSFMTIDQNTSEEALNQFIDMIEGSQTTRAKYKYESVFDLINF